MVDIAPLLRRMGEPPGVVADATLYTRYLIAGTLPYLLFLVLRQTLQAMSIVAPALRAIAGANVVNACANYALIFGHWGLPSLGAAGSACATAAARWLSLLWLLAEARRPLALLFRSPAAAPAVPGAAAQPPASPWSSAAAAPAVPEAAPPPPAFPRSSPPNPTVRRGAAAWRAARAGVALRHYVLLLRIGLPIAVHQTLELSLYMVAALLIGRFGTQALAGHQITLLLACISFMVPLGISGPPRRGSATPSGAATCRAPASRRQSAWDWEPGP